MLAVGAEPAGLEQREAKPGLAGPLLTSQFPKLSLRPCPCGCRVWGPWMPGLGTRTQDLGVGLPGEVLTNGFETCLLRPRDQP